MFIEGPLRSGKTSFLIEKFVELIESGISTDEILIITANSYKKELFITKSKEILLKRNFKGAGAFPVFTFSGIVYNTIKNNWPLVEKIIPETMGKRQILPSLCGLEITEYFIKEALKKINKKENIEETFRDYMSFTNLKHQLLRRLRLITENNLSKKEISERSIALNEQMGTQAQDAFDELKLFSTHTRFFDFLKQINTFLFLIEKEKVKFDNIKYLIVDDMDELNYAAFSFIEKILPKLNSFFIAHDNDGGSRRGYLCAYPEGVKMLIEKHPNTKILKLQPPDHLKEIYSDAQSILNAAKDGFKPILSKIKLVDNSVRDVEMIEHALSSIKVELHNKKIPPNELVIVSPEIDYNLKCALIDFFKQEGLEYQFFSGASKNIDDPIVYGTVILLQLANPSWGFRPKSYEIRSMLTGLLNFSVLDCKNIVEAYADKGFLPEDCQLNCICSENKYKKLVKLVNEVKNEQKKLSEQLETIFTEIISCEITDKTNLEPFNRILSSLYSFEELAKKFDKTANIHKEWFIQLKDAIVADNPASAPEINSNAIKIATPQKVIDLELVSKIQFWLDVSNPAWEKDDTGPLYNAWVFQKNWDKKDFEQKINKKLNIEKSAHVLRKLALCTEEVQCFASQINISGTENNSSLLNYLAEERTPEIKFDFTPRPDQAPVMEYKSGNMAISAVPGAGKTKILEALIIKFIKEGIPPESILVLTYMDSAARNIRDRIKNNCPTISKFPYISTIHGLGLAIISDDDNYSKLGLDANFQICDDTQKYKIFSAVYDRVAGEINLNFNEFIKLFPPAVSRAKLMGIKFDEVAKFLVNKNIEEYSELFNFLPVYREYQNFLTKRNFIDFDDLLIYSVKLLKKFPETQETYKKKFKYIIEDEAQDSSSIQQELISLIGQGNLIRCGDPNQAITSSFSVSDINDFMKFIKNTDNVVEMTGSQRCTKDVYELANSLVDWAESQTIFKGTFLPLKMKPVEGRNPETKNSVNIKIYPAQKEEKYKIIKEITNIKKKNNNLSIGVLLRTNGSVASWANLLEENHIPVVCHSESIAQKKIFSFLFNALQVIANPWDNFAVKGFYKELSKSNFIKYDFDSSHFLDKLGSPFVSFESESLPFNGLKQLHNEITKILNYTNLPPEEITATLGSVYFTDIIDKSNARILSIIISKFRYNYTNSEKNQTITLPEVIEHLRELGFRKKLSGINFFEETEKQNNHAEYVQVMTAHKAKGLEFDVVFIPEIQDAMFYYPTSPEVIKLGTADILVNQLMQVQNINKAHEESKLEQVQEQLRLIYVGITRAKKYLYLSASEVGDKSWTKSKDFRPSNILKHFISDTIKTH